MALVPRLPRVFRLPVAFQTIKDSVYHRSAREPLSPLHLLSQARTATGYAGARKPNLLWKQPTLATGASHNSGPEDTNDNKRRNPKAVKSKKSHNSTQERVTRRDGGKSHSRSPGAQRTPLEVKMSKTLSWILRHGAAFEGLEMREDGFVYVGDLLKLNQLQKLGLTLEQLKGIVKADPKQRFSLVIEQTNGPQLSYTTVGRNGEGDGVWLIRASQGHSISTLKIEFKPILHISDIPSGMAVHGTTRSAWNSIEKEGLSRMERNHIHLAQGVGENGATSGMRRSSEILIFINIQKALDAGIKFYLSDNGVVLTEGDERGFLRTEFFDSVEDAKARRNQAKRLKDGKGSEEIVGDVPLTTS